MRLITILLLLVSALNASAPVTIISSRRVLTAAAAGDYTPNTVDLAGDGQAHLERDAELFPSDSDQLYLSVWVKPDAAEAGTIDTIYIDSTDGVNIYLNSSDLLAIDCDSTINTTVVQLRSTATITRDGNTWTHLFIRIDRTTDNQGQIYVNGVEGTTITTFLSTAEHGNPIDTRAADSAVGALVTSGTLPFAGCMADLWMSVGNTYANMVIGNFYNSGPVDLGSDGSAPDGNQPALFLKGSGTGFTVNSGSGGDMVKKGTTALTTCSTNP